jgi:hypothetical protein
VTDFRDGRRVLCRARMKDLLQQIFLTVMGAMLMDYSPSGDEARLMDKNVGSRRRGKKLRRWGDEEAFHTIIK